MKLTLKAHKMKLKTLFQIFPVLFYLLLITGCTGLSRGKTKQIIERSLKPEYINLSIQFHVDANTGTIQDGWDIWTFKEAESALLKKGYITVSNGNIQLTSKIMPFTITGRSGAGMGYFTTIATFDHVVVTGITGSDDYRTVEYNLVYKRNALGNDIMFPRRLIFSQKMQLRKYDDGWRKD